MRSIAGPLALLVAACGGDQPFDPGRSVEIAFQVSGLPGDGSAEYRVFVRDTVPVAHGSVTNGATDTVRISSSAALRIRWQDALVPVGEADYVYAPGDREVLISESERDTAVSLAGSYSLVSGGFVLTTPGIPLDATPAWLVWIHGDSLLSFGALRAGEAVRRGNVPPGPARLELDSALVELNGLRHVYAPPLPEIPLNVSASLDLIPVDAPYALVSAVVRVSPTGLPAGTHAPWGMTTLAGDYSVGGQGLTDSVQTVDQVPPGSYTMTWGDVTVDGVTYQPTPASEPAMLTPSLVPYEFAAIYAVVP